MLPWLLVVAATVGALVRTGVQARLLAVAVVLLAATATTYLWLTLRAAVTADDLSGAGPTDAQRRLRLGALLAMGGMVVALVLLVPTTKMWWSVVYVVVGAGLALPTRTAAATIGVAVAGVFALTWVVAGHAEPMLLLDLAIGGGAMAVRQLTITVAELRVAREELARRAVVEERLRCSRDLHDLVGHSLSLIAMKSELARRLLPGDVQGAAQEVRDIERGARDALRQVRAAVLGYRQPSLAEELVGARELLGAAGVRLEVRTPHPSALRALPVAVDALLGWSVREGITNVVRHGRAARCVVTVEATNGAVRIVIADDGRGPVGGAPPEAPEAPEGSGTGLVGLAERARAVGGRVRANGAAGGGFELVVEAPLDGARGVGAAAAGIAPPPREAGVVA